MKKRFLFIVLAFGIISSLSAQDILDGTDSNYFKRSGGVDGAYKKDIRDGKRDRLDQKYHHVREADVMWSTKIWRVIDMREKMNQIFYYPTSRIDDRRSLIDVIMDAINLPDGLMAYGGPLGPDDEFRHPMSDAEKQRIGKVGSFESDCIDLDGDLRNDTCFYYDEEDGVEVWELNDGGTFDSKSVVRWKIKEEWYFDKQRSVMDVRIIGLCPVMETEQNGKTVQESLFWVYFPDARRFLKDAEIFNHRKNDAARMTYDDVFHKRFFNSYVYKESNKYDRLISEYKAGLDALYEAERIKEEIFNLEHDLWEY